MLFALTLRIAFIQRSMTSYITMTSYSQQTHVFVENVLFTDIQIVRKIKTNRLILITYRSTLVYAAISQLHMISTS